MDYNQSVSLSIRYIILLILGINIAIIYTIATPLTVYPVFYAFDYLYDATLYGGNVIGFKGYFAHIVDACIAGSAYYFLLILNLTTPMSLAKRLKSLVFLLFSFYLVNVARIIVFGIFFYKGFKYFDFTHLWTWYIGSTIFVVLLWFANIYLLKIKEIPIYSDIKSLLVESKFL
ncbi:MAG: pacearchaeosortase [Nanoarchaeota archaeon]